MNNKLYELVEYYEKNKETIKKNWNETETRIELINPLFECLGWDVNNIHKLADPFKEVKHEASIKIGSHLKAPDYSFNYGKRLFFLEAKKPSIDIETDGHPAYQLRRYGWTAKLPISILTNFEDLMIYDCHLKPSINDNPGKARLKFYTYQDYINKEDEIENFISKEAILHGSLNKFENQLIKGTASIDEDFLKYVENIRKSLALNIVLRNPSISEFDLNFSIQMIIDRIIFLRICEDRGIEPDGTLKNAVSHHNCYTKLVDLFQNADDKYNSGLFHFKVEKNREETPDSITSKLDIDDKVLKDIINGLYYPDCSYAFDVISGDILGSVYEQFIGKVITLSDKSHTHRVKIDYKPEVRKVGGVYYTPHYIVEYIVKNTLGELVKDKKPNEISSIKILDPACGSGSFLIEAYQYLLNWHLDYYNNNEPEVWKKGKEARIFEFENDLHQKELYLTLSERKRILLNNIFGVDIDPQAVEVTKLSLLLKVLEYEGQEIKQPLLFNERVLPDLYKNIKCGNSLIGSDFYKDKNLELFGNDEIQKVNVFDWDKEFSEIFKNGGFNVVVGNPPYVAFDFTNDEKQYFKNKFFTAQYQLDLYIIFIETAVKLLKTNGNISLITPNSWLKNLMMSNCRLFLLENLNFKKIVPKLSNIFSSASVDTLIFFGIKSAERGMINIEELIKLKFINKHQIEQNLFKKNDKFIFTVEIKKEIETIISKFKYKTNSLNNYFEITRGVNPYDVYTGQTRDVIDNKVYHSDFKKDETFVPELRGKHIKRFFYKWDKKHYISYGPWLAAPRDIKFFKGERIIFREILGKNFECTFINKDFIIDRSLYIALPKQQVQNQENFLKIKYFLALLCSNLLAFYFRHISNEFDNLFPKIRLAEFKLLPIKTIDFKNSSEKSHHDRLVFLVDQMLETQNQYYSIQQTDNDKKILKQKIDLIDQQINDLVYKLYDLTEEEIKIVEGNT